MNKVKPKYSTGNIIWKSLKFKTFASVYKILFIIIIISIYIFLFELTFMDFKTILI